LFAVRIKNSFYRCQRSFKSVPISVVKSVPLS
jgi:hypothetical protein